MSSSTSPGPTAVSVGSRWSRVLLGAVRAAERHALVANANLKAAADAEGIEAIPPQAVERVQLLDRHIKTLNRQLTPGVVRVPPAYQPSHAPPPPRPGGPSVGM